MQKTPPLYAEAAKRAPAHIQQWENTEWMTLSPGLRRTTARLLGLLLAGILAYALSGCAATSSLAGHDAPTEHAHPLTAAK